MASSKASTIEAPSLPSSTSSLLTIPVLKQIEHQQPRRHSIAQSPRLSTLELYDEATFKARNNTSAIEVQLPFSLPLAAFGPYLFNYLTLPRILNSTIIDKVPYSDAAVSLYIYCLLTTKEFKTALLTYLTLIDSALLSLHDLFFTKKPHEALTFCFPEVKAKTFAELFEGNNNELKTYFFCTTQGLFMNPALKSLREEIENKKDLATTLEMCRTNIFSTVRLLNNSVGQLPDAQNKINKLYKGCTELLDFTFDMILGIEALAREQKLINVGSSTNQQTTPQIGQILRLKIIKSWSNTPSNTSYARYNLTSPRNIAYDNLVKEIYHVLISRQSPTIKVVLEEKYRSNSLEDVKPCQEYNHNLYYVASQENIHFSLCAQFLLYSTTLNKHLGK